MHISAGFLRQSVFLQALHQQQSHPAPPMVGAVDAYSGAHARDLLNTVAAAAVAAEQGGSVPAAVMVSQRSSAREFLSGAPAVFARMAQLIANAEREVLLQTFQWQDASTPAALMRDALWALHAKQAERASLGPVQPVVVRLMIRRSPVEWFTGRDTEGLEDVVRGMDPNLVRIEMSEHHERLLGALHSKSVVVDGRVALLCGANVQKRFNAGAAWFDTGCVLTGEVVRGLHADALDTWGRCYTRCCNVELPAPTPLWAPLEPDECTPMVVLSRRANGHLLRFNLNTPKDQAVLAAINAATQRICMMSPNVNFEPILQGLCEALRRGVQVDVVLSDHFNDRAQTRWCLQGGNNRQVLARLRQRLADDPQALANLHVRWFSSDGNIQVQGKIPGASHAKGMCVDDCLVLTGSFNFDTQSSRSREIGVAIGSPDAARRWLANIFTPVFTRAVAA